MSSSLWAVSAVQASKEKNQFEGGVLYVMGGFQLLGICKYKQGYKSHDLL